MKKFNDIHINSADVKPGDAFFAIKGYITDGHKFVNDADKRGAEAIYVEHYVDNVDINKQIVVKDTRRELAIVSSQHYNCPSEKMNIVGITGTNGKTTITNICNHVLMSNGLSSAVIGTIGVSINGKIQDNDRYEYAGRTTPESFQLQKMFSNMVEDDVKNCFMEVSSHALYLYRTLATKFKVTAFTNLTQDHLDFHKTMDNYFEAKALLFGPDYPSKRVICIDDKAGTELARRCKNNGDNVITCGLCSNADLNPETVNVNFPLIGKFNTQNMLIAYGICKQLGLKDKQIVSGLESMNNVPGRMELVGRELSGIPKVVVDYAHTPDALHNCLNALKDEVSGKIYCVFGCGGDRDKAKRPIMGKIASELADYCYVTSDNPRSEDPQSILDDIVKGICDDNFTVICDRAKAIKQAIEDATENDLVLIAGKGHEKTQTIGNTVIDFDDCQVALEILCG